MQRQRARLALLLTMSLSPWGGWDLTTLPRGGGTSTAPSFNFHPRNGGVHTTTSSSSSSSPRWLAGALHLGNGTGPDVANIVMVEMGDKLSHPTRSVVGFAQDCVGVPPRVSGALCGATGAFLQGHYLWVAATSVDSVSALDCYRPEAPTVAGTVRDAVRLPQVVATWVHSSNEYVVAVSRGRRPLMDGHLTLIDVRYDQWYKDPSERFLVKPKVLSWLRDCATSDDPTFPNRFGRLCGARALHVVGDLAYVVAETTHTLSIIRLPPRLSDNEMGVSPRTIYPEFVGSIRDGRLDRAYAVAVDGINAFVASRWCKTCVVMVNVMDPADPKLGGRLPRPGGLAGEFYVLESLSDHEAATMLGRYLRGSEHVARGVAAGAPYAFVTTEFDGRVSTVDARCVAASETLGESVQYCAQGARQGLYDLQDAGDNPADAYRANARPNFIAGQGR